MRTSCGSALSGFPSTMFSIGSVKTAPLASHASADGFSVGSTTITGPTTSATTSADTQPSSASSSSRLSCFACDAEGPPASPSAARFRFFGFLSPLKLSGLTMVLAS